PDQAGLFHRLYIFVEDPVSDLQTIECVAIELPQTTEQPTRELGIGHPVADADGITHVASRVQDDPPVLQVQPRGLRARETATLESGEILVSIDLQVSTGVGHTDRSDPKFLIDPEKHMGRHGWRV